MCGSNEQTGSLFSYVSCEARGELRGAGAVASSAARRVVLRPYRYPYNLIRLPEPLATAA